MKRPSIRGLILVTAIVLSTGGRTWAQEQSLMGSWLYTMSDTNIGEFRGTLVRLSCASNANADSSARGEQSLHDYGLMVQGDDAIHPFLAGTRQVRRELVSVGLEGTEVAVQGKYYPSTGMIFASGLVRESPANDQRETTARNADERPGVGQPLRGSARPFGGSYLSLGWCSPTAVDQHAGTGPALAAR